LITSGFSKRFLVEMMKSDSELALKLSDLGWHLFPCLINKRPYTPHGKNDATTDATKIRAWWTRWPDALIGVYCERSGFFAVDLDVKGTSNGVTTWQAWIDQHGQPPALSQSTPSGGRHVLFELPQDLKIPNNANKLAPGVDLRSNGYICTGGPYEWLQSPFDNPLTPAPDWLLDKIRAMGERKPTTTTQPSIGERNDQAGDYWLNHYLAIATPGNRNATGFDLATQLRDSGLSEAEAEGIMLAYCAQVPGSDYSEAEALASLHSAYQQPRREPAKLPLKAAPVPRQPQPPEAPPDAPTMTRQAPPPGDLTDAGNADRLVKQFGDQMRWVADWGWLMWDEKRWLRDKNGLVMRLAKKNRTQHLPGSSRDLRRRAIQAPGALGWNKPEQDPAQCDSGLGQERAAREP